MSGPGTNPGDLLAGRYVVVRPLGEGSMGEVVLARDTAQDDLPVAVKRVKDARAIRWLKNEYETLALLSHPNIPRTWDFCYDRSRRSHLFSVEYVKGVPFTEAMEGASFETLVDYTVRLCRALGYVHGRGYIHCDIKPENVLVERADDGTLGELKLLDFGLAMHAPKESQPARGTLYYMAPEWFSEGVPAPASDWYSVGMLLYYATYDVLPFPDEVDEIIRFHVNDPLPIHPADGIPDWWGALLLRLTAKDPVERLADPSHAVQFINRKGGFEYSLESQSSGEPPSAGGPWLGREEALDELVGWCRAVADPEAAPQSAVAARVRGGEGVGKTRFLEEVKRVLQMEGHDVLYLGPSVGGEPAVRLAHTLSARLGRDESTTRRGDEARELGGLVGEAVELALEAAAAGPLILLLDDVDRGGLTGPAVFSGIARALEFARLTGEVVPPVALIGAAQSGALEEVGVEALILDVEVGPMNRRDLGRFLALQFTSEPLPDALMDDLWAVAHGNPRWAGELAAWMLQAGVARIIGGRWELDARRRRATGLPKTMEQAVRGALASLGDVERTILAVLAATGAPTRLDRLATAAGQTPWDADAAVEHLVERGYARFEPIGRSFLPVVDSPSLQQLVREELGDERWAATHGALLDAMGDPEASARRHPAEVTLHAFAAGRLDLARRWALEGVRELVDRCEFERADKVAEVARAAGCDPVEVALLLVRIATLTGHYQDGIKRLWATLDAGALDGAGRARLLEALAELYFRKGEYKESLGILDGAATLADDAGRRRIGALQARVHMYRGDFDEALAAGEAANVDDDLEPCSRFRGLNIIGLVHSYQGDFERAEDALLEARSGLALCGERMDQAFVLNSLGFLYQKKKAYDEAERHYRESRDVARTAGSAERTNVAGMNLSVLLQERGRYAEAIEQYRETLRQAYRIEDSSLLMRIQSNLGNIHRYLGILDGAREWAERSLAIAHRTRTRLMIGINGILLGEIDLLAGRSREALDRTREALATFEELGVLDETVECLIDLAACHLELGESGEALVRARAAEQQSRDGRLPNHLLRTLLVLARIGLEAGDAAPDLDVEEILDEARGLLDAAGTPELAWRTYLLGARDVVERRRGIPDTALTLMEAALQDLTASVPEAYRRAFFARRDRAMLKTEMERVRTASTALGRTMVVGAGQLVGPGASSAEDLRLTRSLLEMNRHLADVTDLEQILEIFIDTMIPLVDAERGFVLLRGEDRFSVVVARNLDGDAVRRSKAKISRSIADRVLESGKPLVLEDAVEDEYFSTKESVLALRVRSIACLPLTGHQGVVGAIYLDNRFQPGLFSERVVGILDIFARQAALAIENALLHERNREMLEQLTSSNREVERLNKRLQEENQAQKLVLDETREELGRRQNALEERFHFDRIVGQSQPIRTLFQAMERVARTDVSVLILGESGTGKELVARALHYNGPRAAAPFIAVNCGALPDNLLESELFGHERGAFTGAVTQHKGMFTAADKGTLFMDEVGDMSVAMQAKLLRALQEGEFVPVGATASVHADVRIITATNRDLEAMVRAGSFREDLYYRLNVVRIVVPPLRRRTEDIPLLVDRFLSTYSERHDLETPVRIDDQALKAMMLYSWPGNVRELQSTVWTAAVFAEDGVITITSLEARPEVLAPIRSGEDMPVAMDIINLRDLEQRALREALRRTAGNKARAAKLLGISRRALYNKLEAFNIG